MCATVMHPFSVCLDTSRVKALPIRRALMPLSRDARSALPDPPDPHNQCECCVRVHLLFWPSSLNTVAPRRTPGRAGAAWSVRGSGSCRDTVWWCLVAAYRLSCRPSPRKRKKVAASCRPRRRRGRAFSLARALRWQGRAGRSLRRRRDRDVSAAIRTASC